MDAPHEFLVKRVCSKVRTALAEAAWLIWSALQTAVERWRKYAESPSYADTPANRGLHPLRYFAHSDLSRSGPHGFAR